MHESILNSGGYRYLWFSVLLVGLSVLLYAWHSPGEPANGGTWLGYTLGAISAGLIFWLMFFGIRKRSYMSSTGSARGWVSAHIYLGTSLIILATLHSGFQFGWNVHTLAWVLMILVIISGMYGVFAYLRYPTLMTQNRADMTRAAMLDEIAQLDEDALRLADRIDTDVHAVVSRSVERTKIGGSMWQQLRAHNEYEQAILKTDELLHKKERQADTGVAQKAAGDQDDTMVAMIDYLSRTADSERAADVRRLLDLLSRKKYLAARLTRDIQYQAFMDIWLYIHVPLSFALLGALIAHIITVFFYW